MCYIRAREWRTASGTVQDSYNLRDVIEIYKDNGIGAFSGGEITNCYNIGNINGMKDYEIAAGDMTNGYYLKKETNAEILKEMINIVH